jgi:hypothetical protein
LIISLDGHLGAAYNGGTRGHNTNTGDSTMFASLQDALDFFRSLESPQAVVNFVAENGNKLEGWEVSAAGLALAKRGK